MILIESIKKDKKLFESKKIKTCTNPHCKCPNCQLENCPCKKVEEAKSAVLSSKQDVKAAMHKLWEDHIVYTRNYIISALAELEDIDVVSERLFKNQDDIGDAIKPYYGADAGKKLSTLLREHIKIATEVVSAAKDDKKQKLESSQKRWVKNGKDIAHFLNKANTNWNMKDLEKMLQKHLDLTTKEAVSRLKKDWSQDIKAYDENHIHMLMFADMLVDGIAKQFPDKFSD